MRTTELRELLGKLEESPAPEPSPLFASRLEAELRTMDRTVEAEGQRPRRRRMLVAAAPIAALAATAAAAAATLLPSDSHPRQLRTADPGVTAPAAAPVPQTPPSSMPTPTTAVVTPPWLPPVTAPAPPTTAAVHAPTATLPPRPAEHPGPTVAPPHEPVATTVPPPTTTTVPAPETLSLHCSPGVTGGNPVVGCGWTESTSQSFKWYRLWRAGQGSPFAVVFQSDNRATISYYDQAVQAATNYYYKVDVIDAAGNVLGTSNVAAISCC